jgi:hypothetical protein
MPGEAYLPGCKQPNINLSRNIFLDKLRKVEYHS